MKQTKLTWSRRFLASEKRNNTRVREHRAPTEQIRPFTTDASTSEAWFTVDTSGVIPHLPVCSSMDASNGAATIDSHRDMTHPA